MGSLFTGIATVLVLAVIAGLVAVEVRTPAYNRYTTQSVRVGDAGHNLVGPDWTGLNTSDPHAEKPQSAK